ncbi:MAG TPA: hypothetical protein VMY42_22520 [Thermoguttaceae bacterium]|nr:hypothetical protein [Thermoguttaceae bacterium]
MAWSRQKAKIVALNLAEEEFDWPTAWKRIRRRFPKAVHENDQEEFRAIFEKEREFIAG